MELREFGIRDICYVNYRYMVVGEIAISLPTQSCSKGMVSYPELTQFLCISLQSTFPCDA